MTDYYFGDYLSNFFNIILNYYGYKKYVILAILFIIGCLIIAISIIIAKKVEIKESLDHFKTLLLMGYRKLDDKAKSQLIYKLQMTSDNLEYKVKLNLFDRLDLKLIERSNIKSFIPFFNIYLLFIITIVLFVFLFPIILSLFKSWKTAIVISLFISLIPSLLLDTLTVYNSNKSRKATSNFLSLLLSWLEVKNDLLFAFTHVVDDIDEPLKFYISDAVVQLNSGINPEMVFDILSYKINTDQFYTITKNFKSVINNGGDVVELVRVLEDEAYKVDNEFETRVTDTFTSRFLLNVLLIFSAFFLVGFVFINPTLNQMYTNTVGGKNIMFVSTAIFLLGFLFNLKSSTKKL